MVPTGLRWDELTNVCANSDEVRGIRRHQTSRRSLDEEREDIQQEEDHSQPPRRDTKAPPFGEEEVYHASEDHIDESVEP